MIPSARLFQLALLAPLLVFVGRGSPTSISIAWSLLAVLSLAFVADAWLAKRQRGLALERRAPPQLYLEQPTTIQWILDNRASRALKVRLRDGAPPGAKAIPEEFSGVLPPGSRTVMPYEVTPMRRGQTTFGDLVLRTLGPLGLAWSQQTIQAAQAIRVFPQLANWKAAELAERRALMRQSGSHRYRWRGAGTLFESLRDYSQEDDYRWIEWKATARLQRPISRNYEVERHQQVILLVDASRMLSTYCGHRTKFDAILEATVLASRSILNQGDSLGLVIFSDRVETHLPARRDRSQLQAVMDAIYDRQPRLVDPDFESALNLTAQRAGRRSLIILFTDITVVEPARRMMAYVRRLVPRHLPLVVTIADETIEQIELTEPQTPEDLYRIGIASELSQQRSEILQQLRAGGVQVLDSHASQVATRTIERYLDLKRQMRL